MLKEKRPDIHWSSEAREHYVEHGSGRTFYPSLKSLDDKIKLARRLGVGLSIWEIGQGLDYFYDLL
jgi:chitinase domain-containing protein 1